MAWIAKVGLKIRPEESLFLLGAQCCHYCHSPSLGSHSVISTKPHLTASGWAKRAASKQVSFLKCIFLHPISQGGEGGVNSHLSTKASLILWFIYFGGYLGHSCNYPFTCGPLLLTLICHHTKWNSCNRFSNDWSSWEKYGRQMQQSPICSFWGFLFSSEDINWTPVAARTTGRL